MPSGSRPFDRGTERGRRLRVQIGAELRASRSNRGLRLHDVCDAVGVSISTGSRVERGVLEHVDVMLLARMCAVVGLDLSLRAYPGGEPIRDARQLRLLRRFQELLHPTVGWATEVPLPGTGDHRAWDGFIQGRGWRYGVEAETAPNDVQATLRRLALKRRDGQVDGVLLVMPETRRAREFVQELGSLADATFPIPGVRAIELLRVGADPGGSAMIVLPRPRAS